MVKLTVEFQTVEEAAQFLLVHTDVYAAVAKAAFPVAEAGALEGARQDDGSAMLPQPKINTRKPRTTRHTEPAAPATAVAAEPMGAEIPAASAPVAAAPDTFVPPLGPTFTKPVPPVEAAAGPAAQHAETPSPAATLVTQPAATAPDNAAAQAAIEAVFAAKGFQGAHQLLGQFGVQRLRELDSAKYGELIEYANDMLVK